MIGIEMLMIAGFFIGGAVFLYAIYIAIKRRPVGVLTIDFEAEILVPKMLNSHEIIDEVANFYNLGNRSTYGTTCLYNGSDGKQCAFARMCVDPSELEEGVGAKNTLDKFGIDILKPEYRGHDYQLFHDVQVLHDNEWYWTEEGISEEGKKYVEELKKKWPIDQ